MKICQLGSGKYSDCFRVSNGAGCALAMKLSFYRESTMIQVAQHADSGNVMAAYAAKDKDAVSVAAGITQVATAMRDHNVTPHIVKVFVEADVRNLPLRLSTLLPDRLATLTTRQTRFSHVCLMELCDSTLSVFATRAGASDRVIRCLIFQVLFTLACLQSVLPGFRHNDLSTNNILVRNTQQRTAKYIYQDHTMWTANMTCAVALSDFDFTHVPGHGSLQNERVLSGRYGITAEPNDGYDSHVFLSSLRKVLHRNTLPYTCAFLDSLHLHKTSRPTGKCHHLSPLVLLRHPYFAPLAVGPSHTHATFTLPHW